MKERPIILYPHEIRAVMAQRQTQLRRVAKPQPPEFVQHTPDVHPAKHPAPYIDAYCSQRKTEANPRGMGLTWCWWTKDDRQGDVIGRCPYGQPGDRLAVCEGFAPRLDLGKDDSPERHRHYCKYRADMPAKCPPWDEMDWHPYPRAWRSAAQMPRMYSRILLEVESVRVERVQEISEADIQSEGAVERWHSDQFGRNPVSAFDGKAYLHLRELWGNAWNSINEKRGYGWGANPWVWVVQFRVVNAAE